MVSANPGVCFEPHRRFLVRCEYVVTHISRHIDYGYAMKFANICKEKNVKTYALVSAVNADAGSFFLYPKVKGEVCCDMYTMAFDPTPASKGNHVNAATNTKS